MARIKNAVKVAADESQPSLWAELPLLKQQQLAVFGDGYSAEAITVLDEIATAIKLEKETFETQNWHQVFNQKNYPGVSNAKDYKKVQSGQNKDAWRLFKKHFSIAFDNGDGSFFRKMAFCMECYRKKPVAAKRAAFIHILQLCQLHKLPLPTPAKMREYMNDLLKSHRLVVSYTNIRNFQKYCGVKLPHS